MCGVPVADYELIPEHRREQALVIIRGRREAAKHFSKSAGALIPPDFFMGL